MKILFDENIGSLEQAITLLPRLTPQQYGQKLPACFNASVGGHIRHNIDHYLSFIDGLPSGKIDYEARRRDPHLETDRDYALQTLKTIIERLNNLEPTDKGVLVKMENVTAGDPAEWALSTARRELQFLLSHTIHHYALVGVSCRLLGVEPGPEFGIAPSTLRYRQSLKVRVA